MSESTTLSIFPDLNVWLALSSPDHKHFPSAWKWYKALPDQAVLIFCRFTQLGFLRLLTTQSVMGPGTLTQSQAWEAYDRWRDDAGAEFSEEPPELEFIFRSFTAAHQASPKEWADAYLGAFGMAAGLTLVTFDRALAGKVSGSALLRETIS
jgi:hypothetical protein